MGSLKNSNDFKEGEFLQNSSIKKKFLIIGLVGTILFFLIKFIKPEYSSKMAYSWLFSVIFFMSLSIGGIFWTLLHNVSNSSWGIVVRRQMENLGMLVFLSLFLSIPLIIPQFGFRDSLWEWFPERKNVIHEASKSAKKKSTAYIESHKNKIRELDNKINKINSDLSGQKYLSPGVKLYMERKLLALKTKKEKLTVEDISKESVIKKLESKFFKHNAALLYAKRGYLNEKFWYIRFIFYVVSLISVAYFLRSWSVKQDADGDVKWFLFMRKWSCLFLPIFAVAWTFLVFDWLMALDYAWFSTMWGVYLFAGAALNSMGVLIIIITALRKNGYLKNVINLEHYQLMGKLFHAFVIFWAYIAFSQFFLIWYANITEETKFYLIRNTGFWNMYTIMFLVIGHFFIPFLILLVRKVKRTPALLSAVAMWSLFMHIFDIYWIIIPERGPSISRMTGGDLHMSISGAWVFDILAFVSIAGIFIYFLIKTLESTSLYPSKDSRLDESLNVLN